MNYETLTYEEMAEECRKIKILDSKLPSLDDLEMPKSKFQMTEVEKQKQQL
jgi:hypothetical protein